MPGTMLDGSQAPCSIWLWWSVGFAIQCQLADLDQRVGVWPHLGQIERVEPVGLGLIERHDLHLQRPGRVLATLDRLEQVTGVVIGVELDQLVGLGLGQVRHALIGDEMVFDPEPFAVALIHM